MNKGVRVCETVNGNELTHRKRGRRVRPHLPRNGDSRQVAADINHENCVCAWRIIGSRLAHGDDDAADGKRPWHVGKLRGDRTRIGGLATVHVATVEGHPELTPGRCVRNLGLPARVGGLMREELKTRN